MFVCSLNSRDSCFWLRRWSDSERYPDSWEDEENISAILVAAWEKEQPPELLQRQSNGAGTPRRQQRQKQKPKSKQKQPAAVPTAEAEVAHAA